MTLPERDRPLVIGLTGPIAAGKSQVAAFLAELGAEVIDADAVYRELITPPSPLLDRIAERFGPEILDASGALDRAALGNVVFNNARELAALEGITHPVVIAEVRRRIANSQADVVVNEAIRLVESGMASDVDALWLVTAEPEVRLRRLMARNSLDETTARERLVVSQPSLPDGLLFDEVIDNSGSLDEMRANVRRAWKRLPLNRKRVVLQEGTIRERARKG
ncbi:MAG: dephospho-CoA kinase [Thermomicrobiales bacterium]